MKNNLILFLLSIIISPCQAQISVGLQTGISINHIDNAVSSLPYTKNSHLKGIALGGQVNYRLLNWLSIRTSFLYLKKSNGMERSGPFAGIYSSFINAYLQLPVAACFDYRRKRISLFANAEFYGGYWISARQQGKIPNIFSVTSIIGSNGQSIERYGLTPYNEKYSFNIRKDNRYEFGVSPGAGGNYTLRNGLTIGLEAHYFHSLTDLQKNYAILLNSRKNRTWAFFTTLIYEIGPKNRKTRKK